MNFEDQLKNWCHTPTGPYRRPFAPNPNWEKAQVFIVGTNPATPLRNEFTSFNEYWAGLTRTPSIFSRRYTPKHASGASQTTDWAREFVSMLHPLNCIVTNTAWYPAPRPKHVPAAEWRLGAQMLDALIQHCRPAAIFCHGSKAEEFARSLGAPVDRYVPAAEQDVVLNGTLVLAFHHFTGQGLRKHARFQPASELPIFASRIRAHAGVA